MLLLGEKVRSRLGNLEALEASIAQRSPITGSVQPELILGHDVPDRSISGSSTTRPMNRQHEAQTDITPSEMNIWDFTTNLTPSNDSLSSMGIWDSTAWDYTTQLSHMDITPSTLGDVGSTKQAPSLGTLSTPSSWVSPADVVTSLERYDRRIENTDCCRTTTTVECCCVGPHIQIQTRSPTPTSYIEVRILRVGLVAPAPDPYANILRLETLCTLSAMDALRLHVGITEGMMCEGESPSPFYRSIRATADGTTRSNMISTIQRIFKTLKPDLRPDREQITVEHPPYIDVLPFRTLRKNLILHPQDVDEDEFLRDLVTGLVCWGGAGIGKRDRDALTGIASDGNPWDNRSWEGKPWFLKKYWSLLGGEEGELVRQSEWWRSVRGEDPLLVDVME